MESYFRNIKEKLIQEINKSEFIIHAAVAWITDFQIISTLIERLKAGIKIELIVNDDDTFSKRLSEFNEFRNNGGQLFLFKNDKALMHDKFSIIDLSTTITGSFNWSFNASTINRENIVIERDNLVTARNYAREFKDIKKSCVLFEGRRTYYELASYAEVTSIFGTGDDDEKWIQIIVEDGNKWAIVGFDFNFFFNKTPSPKKLMGFWREKQIDYSGKDIVVDGKTLYNFEICDPIYDQWAYK